MNRFEFLKKMGFGGVAAAAVLLQACKNDSDPVSPTTGNVDFAVDLTAAANAALLKAGGYIIQNSVVVARTTAGTYVAATVVCSHEGQRQVTFTNANEFYCTAHGARYDPSGKGLNAEGSRGLKTYTVTQSGNTLRITG